MHEPQPIGPLTPDQFRRIREIFESALEQPIADRHAWLEAVCGGATALRQQVERMLVADHERHHLLDQSADATFEPASLACPSCGATVVASQRFCPSCGTPTAAAGPLAEGRFRAGALFAGRFRIIALQGRGGMGQVYRAQDLELGQPVALKFLTAFRSDPRARSRLRTEVRLARQIAHPNVCRVYDIGEATGELYLSMEYVDGEDLAGLLKRIGRLPADKGLDIARKLCAGLAAAHARSVLHRDFKPGNIMIDSRGEVRIMDFGLAAVAEQQLDAADVRSGTPAYMAPEQLEGREATTRSDIYALGLVLYELFTGRPAFEEKDAAELLRLRSAHPSTTPSTLVPDLDPAVERTILRCLEPDPRMRPASALEVAASLPGGDPLAEALAAGETPSPDLVAAASPDTVLRPAIAVALVVVIGVGLAGMLVLTKHTQIVSMVPKENPPDVLASKAREIVRTLGHPNPAADVAYGFRYERGHLDYIAKRVSPGSSRLMQWKTMLGDRPAPVSFWYAQSPGPVVPVGPLLGRARPIDAFPAVRDGVSVDLDLDGRLLRFVVPPPRRRAPSTPAGVPEWSRLFSAAGLDLEHFKSTALQPGVSTDADVRAAWTGSYPGHTDLPIRIEATASAGAVTSFAVVFPWTNREPPFPQATGYLNAVLVIIFSIGPILVARHNWLRGRAEVRGAVRIGAVAFLAALAFRLLDAHDALNAFVTRSLLAFAAGQGALMGMLYLALEPWVRRWWPHAMIGWARVVAGRWRDPLVARDVLVALATIVALGCVTGVAQLGSILLGGRLPEDVAPSLASARPGFVLANLEGERFTAASLLHSISSGIPFAASIFFLLAMFRSLLRKPWLGIGAFMVFAWAMTLFRAWAWGGPPDWTIVAAAAAVVAVVTVVALRFGLLVVVVMQFAQRFLDHSILTTDIGAWYGRSSLIAVLLVSAVTIWAFRVSLGGRSLLHPRGTRA